MTCSLKVDQNQKRRRDSALASKYFSLVVRFWVTISQLNNTSYREYGGVAQLGEHLPCKQGVMGSIPIISTIGERERDTPKTYMGS